MSQYKNYSQEEIDGLLSRFMVNNWSYSSISDISDGTLGNSFVIAGYAQTGIIQVPFSETITINLPAPVNNALSTIESFL